MVLTRLQAQTMAVQLTEEQFQRFIEATQTPPRSRHFTQCTARYDGTRTQAAVTEFITAITIFKTVEKVTDADAITGLPLLLTGEANTWWNGVKNTVTTFAEATEALKHAFAPQRPNFRIFQEIYSTHQTPDMSTDRFVTTLRDKFSQLAGTLSENWQLDMVYALLRPRIRDRIDRNDITTFQGLLQKARIVEAAEQDHKGPKPAKTGPHTEKTKTKCEFCKNFGHTIVECRKKAKAHNAAADPKPGPNPPSLSNPIQCYGCGKPGVIRRNCPQCSPATTPLSFCCVDTRPIERPAVEITIHGMRGTAFLDSGAKATLASPDLYRILAENGHTFAQRTIDLIQADGKSRITTVQTTTTTVFLKDRQIETTFLVLPDTPNAKTLLGIDFLHAAGLVIDYKHGQWHFHGDRHRCYKFISKDQLGTASRGSHPEATTSIGPQPQRHPHRRSRNSRDSQFREAPAHSGSRTHEKRP